MSIHSTKLKLRATGRMISAELHDDLAVESLFEAEKVWGPERTEFLRECIKAGVKDLPQSIHWNWPTKAATRFPGLKTNALTGYRLFGIKAENNWQGLLLAVCVGYQSRIPPGEKDIVYVEFVETAPWNWKKSEINRKGKYKGVGRQLIELAVWWSRDLGFRGRVGLHALPQAVPFYNDHCGMTDFGVDDSEYVSGLPYFEFSEPQAKAFLGKA